MKRFAQLFEELDRTTRTSEKVDALERYFAEAPPADAAWAVHFLSGERPKRLLPVRRLAAWAEERTGTPDWLFEECYAAVGDLAETIAMKNAFGAHARKLAVSGTKSMTGHLLGAAGAVEAIFSVLAIRDQVAPPTINLDNPGEGCDLDYVPNTAREKKIEVAMSNGFGFGGTNGTLVFRKL